MVKIVGKSTFYGTAINSTTSAITFTSSNNFNATMYVCPADGNVFTLEHGKKRRKYCSDNCRYKVRDAKKKDEQANS